jgi:16S rRNA U516 pseudouridylate synthase RsuA-like enzyme
VASRRESEKLIEAGRIKVNGQRHHPFRQSAYCRERAAPSLALSQTGWLGHIAQR